MREQSETSAAIFDTISHISSASDQSASNVHEAVIGLKEIAQSSEKVSHIGQKSAADVRKGNEGVTEIARFVREAASGVGEVDVRIGEILESMEATNYGVADIQTHSEALAGMAEELQRIVSSFQVKL